MSAPLSQPGRSTSSVADVTVIGAGIVGLATATALQRSMPGAQVLVLDKESAPAEHQSGRNSGVVHSGIYYAPGSAKATLVADGRARLERYCADRGLAYQRCGKVIVATDAAQLAPLEALHQRALDNDVAVERIGPQTLTTLEPHARGVAALHVPSAAITDYAAVARSLRDDVVVNGGEVSLSTTVVGIRADHVAQRVELRCERAGAESSIRTRWLVNCAGLHSDRMARMAGATTAISIVAFRGDYHELRPAARSLVRGLVYPVPDPRWPFLGVHATRTVDGSVHIGPNAVVSLGREAYEGGVVRDEMMDLLRDPGLRRLARRYWRTGAVELIRSRSTRLLLRDLNTMLPEVTHADLAPAPSGIRAQALSADGALLDDFEFGSSFRAVHVLNAPSPAATASLAIGEVVADRVTRAASAD